MVASSRKRLKGWASQHSFNSCRCVRSPLPAAPASVCDHGLRSSRRLAGFRLARRHFGGAPAQSPQFMRAAAPIERDDVVVDQRPAFFKLIGIFLSVVADIIAQRTDRKLADQALLLSRQPLR